MKGIIPILVLINFLASCMTEKKALRIVRGTPRLQDSIVSDKLKNLVGKDSFIYINGRDTTIIREWITRDTVYFTDIKETAVPYEITKIVYRDRLVKDTVIDRRDLLLCLDNNDRLGLALKDFEIFAKTETTRANKAEARWNWLMVIISVVITAIFTFIVVKRWALIKAAPLAMLNRFRK